MPTWWNRIVGYSEEDPGQLLASPHNWRVHPKSQQEALLGLFEQVGIVQNIICNRTTGHVVDGHLRISLAMREGQSTVPVTWVELTEPEEALILATLDPLSAMAVADKGKLDELLRQVDTGDAAIQQMLSQLAGQSGIIDPVDYEKLWQGMPEFEQGDASAYRRLVVYFACESDVKAFAALIGQDISDSAKWIWHPKQVREDFLGKAYQDES